MAVLANTKNGWRYSQLCHLTITRPQGQVGGTASSPLAHPFKLQVLCSFNIFIIQGSLRFILT